MPTAGSTLLRLPVRLHGIEVGRPVDLLLTEDGRRAVGLEVLCGDGVRRFLPLRAASISPDEICIVSAFTLLDGEQLDFYRESGRILSEVRGEVVENAGAPVGRLEDVVLDEDYAVVELEVGAGTDLRRVPKG